MGSKNITCTSEMRLHFSSAAKKVQNQIWVGRISHIHQKCVLTLTLCVHQKCVRFFRFGWPLSSLPSDIIYKRPLCMTEIQKFDYLGVSTPLQKFEPHIFTPNLKKLQGVWKKLGYYTFFEFHEIWVRNLKWKWQYLFPERNWIDFTEIGTLSFK